MREEWESHCKKFRKLTWSERLKAVRDCSRPPICANCIKCGFFKGEDIAWCYEKKPCIYGGSDEIDAEDLYVPITDNLNCIWK
jgi:hypothetical protein